MSDYQTYNQTLNNKLAVAGTAIAPTLPTGTPRRAYFINEGPGDVKWLATGTAPTATTGTYLYAGDELDMNYGDHWGMIGKIQFIRAASSSATIDCSFYD